MKTATPKTKNPFPRDMRAPLVPIRPTWAEALDYLSIRQPADKLVSAMEVLAALKVMQVDGAAEIWRRLVG